MTNLTFFFLLLVGWH